jgi:SRSO17 transposase
MMLHTPNWSPYLMQESSITEEMVRGLGEVLDSFLLPFHAAIVYRGQEKYIGTFVKGFLSDLQYKSAEPIALRYGESVRGTQRFLTTAKWDTQKMEMIYQATLSKAISNPMGMITIDESGEPKKGGKSVGVARQYIGTLGKTDNGQVGVFVGYASSIGYGLIDRQLYIPEKWYGDDYEPLRKECGIPTDLSFQTKPEIASSLLDKVVASGLFDARWVGVDCLYGSNKEFLDSIPEHLWYFADVPMDTYVFLKKPEMVIPEYTGKGRRSLKAKPSIPPIQVKQVADDESIPWNKVILGEGAKGPIIAHEKCIRIVRCDNNCPNDAVWLYIRKLEDGTCKYSFSNAPWDTPVFVIREAALMRWPIEQCFLECKNELGLDHCEARSWNSWHRHTLLVFVAHLFLTILRLEYKKKPLF